MSVMITTTLAQLWNTWGNGADSGRVPCPIVARQHRLDPAFTATHLYCGYGQIRLESIKGQPVKGRKGFQGEEFHLPAGHRTGYMANATVPFLIED